MENGKDDQSVQAFIWLTKLCEFAKEDIEYRDSMWNRLMNCEEIYKEFCYYLENGQFLAQYAVCGMTLIDIMIWQMDHFKSDLDRGLYDMQSNPDKMILKAFETMFKMQDNPDKYTRQFSEDTGTDYLGKY